MVRRDDAPGHEPASGGRTGEGFDDRPGERGYDESGDDVFVDAGSGGGAEHASGHGDRHDHVERDHQGHDHPGADEPGHDDRELYDEYDRDGYDERDGHDGYDDEGVIGDRPRRNRRGRTRLVAIAVAVLVLVAGIGVAAAGLLPIISSLTASKDYEGPGTGQVTYTVRPGDTYSQIADGLQKAGVVMTTTAFTDALAEHPGPEVQPGQYNLRSQMKAVDALSLLRGEGRQVVKVTLREGLWKREVYAALSKATGLPVADYTKAEAAAKSSPDSLGLPASAQGNVEGYLFPATYEFTPGASATEQLRALVGKSTSQLRQLGVNDAEMERTVIVASLVEAEARLDADRPKVARVIENRLAKKMPLQFDSTVNYGVQRKSITTTDAERAAKNGYNTYVRPGLPAGPIGNPGAASIKAAQAPAAGPWLYFVTVDPSSGATRFAVTGEQHQANVALFQKWCQAHPGQC